jgi:hypothetical protein
MADVGTMSAQSLDGAGDLLRHRQLCFALTVAAAVLLVRIGRPLAAVVSRTRGTS